MKTNKLLIPFFLIFILVTPSYIYALDMYAFYSGSCSRDIGAIINIDEQTVDVLTTSGKVINLPRYKVIYLSTYPIDILTFNSFKTDEKIPVFKIKTRVGNKIKHLLTGWPVNFTNKEVSFITTSGDEVLVKKKDLWGLNKSLSDQDLKFSSNPSQQINYLHPYPFSHCKQNIKGLAPQKLFTDAIDIKREFDRIHSGHKELDKFISRQKFYPGPEVYTNKSTIGMWLMMDGRYGKSKSRSFNFSPQVINELSTGAYSYQHELSTGAGPLLYLSHLELQSHFYYRMKAEYTHFSFMLDPSLLLVGSQYDWRVKDLDNNDFRMHESSIIELGLDIGRWSLELQAAATTHFGAKLNDSSFFEETLAFPKYGLRYTGLQNTFIFFMGAASDDYTANNLSLRNKLDLNMFRFNHIYKFTNSNELISSVVSKSAEFSGDHSNKMSSLSLSFNYKYQLKKRYHINGLLGLEKYSIKTNAGNNDDILPLVAINANLEF